MLEHLTTEGRNPASEDLDGLTAPEIVQLINSEDAKVAAAVAEQGDVIAQAIDVIAERLGRGGRLIYLGAGTSGRIAVQDGAELPPTYNWPLDRLVFITDHAEILMQQRHLPDELVLDAIGVLVLIHKNVAESTVVGLANIGSFVEERHSLQKEIIKIERVRLAQLPLVKIVDKSDLGRLLLPCLLVQFLR